MHPIVAQMGVSPEQEPAVLTRGRDVVVTAGAGTGKTRALVARYLSLLAEGLELRSIVAITFTRKAAREMRNRVRDDIRRFVQRPDLEDGERWWWQDLYSRLDAARIGTIHSLCTEILRNHPVEAAVDPRFAVLEEGEGNVLKSRAADEALAWAADDSRGVALFTVLGEHDLRKALAALLGQRLDAEAALSRLPSDVLAYWQAAFSQQGVPDQKLNASDEKLAQALPALRSTLQVALERLDAFKSERNALDFDDLEGRALELLQQSETVRSRWRGAVKAILMDEFQDTNQRQRDLVALLDDGQKLFIVGDAKQSIYRFRGADVVVFRHEREHIEEAGGLHCALQTSYRAHKELVLGLNDLLRPVLGERTDPQRPWVEPFQPLHYHRLQAAPGFVAPHIELHLAVGSKKQGALDCAALALAGRLVELVTSGRQVMVGDHLRPLDWGDFAILCRASTSFAAYEDALDRAGIPFLTVAGRGFHGRPEIRDLLNALRALADPSDDLALVGLLRSPVLGLTDADLFHLCQERSTTVGTPLWEVMRKGRAGGSSWAADRSRAERAVSLITELHRQVGRASVADLLKSLLDATHYRAALIETGDARSARNVDKLLADAHTSGIVGVGEFLEYLDALKGSGAREGEARATAEGAVQIMSVHQAKGLEFPVVVIGDVTHRPGGRNATIIDPELGILLKPKDENDLEPAAWQRAKQRADDQEEAESHRLFYVAATRAQEKLILSGCIHLGKGNAIGKPGGWLGTIGGPDALCLQGKKVGDYRPDGDGIIPLPLEIGHTVVSCTLYEPEYHVERTTQIPAGQADSQAPLPPPLLGPLSPLPQRLDPRVVQLERTPPQRVWRVVPGVKSPKAPAWVIGSLVHEALAAWSFPQEHPSTGTEPHFERWAEARARGYGLTDAAQLADAVSRSARLLWRFRAHPLYQEMATADRRLHEVPYSLQSGEQPESGILDALYQRNGHWTVVEFKTDELRDETALQRLLAEEDYLPQARRYLAAAESLLGQQPRLLLCLLNLAHSVAVRDLREMEHPGTP